MKILFSSFAFPPSTGGIEVVAAHLISELVERGHDPTIITHSPGPDEYLGLKVVRNPSINHIIQLHREADAVFGNHLSLRLLFPLLWMRKKKHCILLHTHLSKKFPSHQINRILINRGNTYAVSKELAISHGLSADKVIYNGYDSSFLAEGNDKVKKYDFLYAGRLVSDKGCDLLIEAMNQLPETRSCIIVGDGPERETLEKLAKPHIQFKGRVEQDEISQLMQQAKWVVVPSRWKEPFGLVAIEAIAAGAAVIASNQGGLPEAVGPCGLLFESNNSVSLQEVMQRTLNEEQLASQCLKARSSHLSQFSYAKQANSILKIFQN